MGLVPWVERSIFLWYFCTIFAFVVDIKSLIAYSSVAHIGLVLRELVVFGKVSEYLVLLLLLGRLWLVSYALVIFYQNEKSANAGILTVLFNRVGDVVILLRISLIYNKEITYSFFCLTSSCHSSSYPSICFSSFFYVGYS
ncbi:NADH-ubiquinone oxidoreductase chain 5-like 3, partial [Homarus americanus]